MTKKGVNLSSPFNSPPNTVRNAPNSAYKMSIVKSQAQTWDEIKKRTSEQMRGDLADEVNEGLSQSFAKKCLREEKIESIDDWRPSAPSTKKRIPSKWRAEQNKSSIGGPNRDDCRKMRMQHREGIPHEEICAIFDVKPKALELILAKRWECGLMYSQQPEVARVRIEEAKKRNEELKRKRREAQKQGVEIEINTLHTAENTDNEETNK